MRPAKGATVVLATVLAVLVLWQLHIALIYLLGSLAAAAAVNQVADTLARRGVPRWLGLLAAYAGGMAMGGALLWLIGRAVVIEAPRSADHYAAAYDRLKAHSATVHGLARAILDRLPASKELYREIGGAQSAALALGALDITRRLLDGVVLSILALVLSVYWAGRTIHLERLVGALLGPGRRDTVFRHFRTLAAVAGAHLRRGLVECSLCAVALALSFSLFGVEGWALAASVGSLALLIPFVGPALTVAVAGLAGLASGPAPAIGSGLSALAIVVLVRWVVARRLAPLPKENPLVLLAATMVLASAAGLLGIVLAPFATAALTVTARRLLARRVASRAPALDPAAFAERARLLRAALGAAPQVPDELRDLVDRLHLLVEEGEASLAARS